MDLDNYRPNLPIQKKKILTISSTFGQDPPFRLFLSPLFFSLEARIDSVLRIPLPTTPHRTPFSNLQLHPTQHSSIRPPNTTTRRWYSLSNVDSKPWEIVPSNHIHSVLSGSGKSPLRAEKNYRGDNATGVVRLKFPAKSDVAFLNHQFLHLLFNLFQQLLARVPACLTTSTDVSQSVSTPRMAEMPGLTPLLLQTANQGDRPWNSPNGSYQAVTRQCRS